VCCISLTDQEFPLCSVNVLTESEALSQRTIVPKLGVPMPYTKSFSTQEWIVNKTWAHPNRDDQRIVKLWASAFASYPSLSDEEYDQHDDSISDEAGSLENRQH